MKNRHNKTKTATITAKKQKQSWLGFANEDFMMRVVHVDCRHARG